MEPGRLTGRGREVAGAVAECYVEVDIDRKYDSKDECRDLAASEGFELIASGLTRDVFVLDDDLVDGDETCVVKIPTRLLGAYENAREVRAWNRLPPEVTRHLAPVRDHDLQWVVMPYAEQDLTSAEITGLWSDLSSAGWAIEDANWEHNLGRIHGRPVVLDYGGRCHRIEDVTAGSTPSRSRL